MFFRYLTALYPILIAIAAFVAFELVRRSDKQIQSIVSALNSVGSQPTAIAVLLIGCVMIVVCKRNGIDPTIAGGIIGVASNMLTSMFSKQHTTINSQETETTIPK
jgi:ABC-type uncharacterized transport system permease subunit